MVSAGYWKYQGEHFVKYIIKYYAVYLKLIQNNTEYKLYLKKISLKQQGWLEKQLKLV